MPLYSEKRYRYDQRRYWSSLSAMRQVVMLRISWNHLLEPPHLSTSVPPCSNRNRPQTKVLCGSPSTNLDRARCRSSHEIVGIYGSKQECLLKPASLPRFVPKWMMSITLIFLLHGLISIIQLFSIGYQMRSGAATIYSLFQA